MITSRAKAAAAGTTFGEVGERLKDLRAALGMSADHAAQAVGVSRALLYRYEGGDIVKLDILERLSRLYGTSVTALLGSRHEYAVNGVAFFERLEKLEAEAEHITTVFGPLAFTLSSDSYDEALSLALSRDDGPDSLTPAEVQRLKRVLRRRKADWRARRPGFVNIIPLAEIAAYARAGTSADHLSASERAAQRRHTLTEIEHLCSLIERPPMGVQIALTERSLPTSGFQVLRMKTQRLLVMSPFRLGPPINLRYGIASISGDEEALRLHENLIARLWDSALTGARAVAAIERLTKA